MSPKVLGLKALSQPVTPLDVGGIFEGWGLLRKKLGNWLCALAGNIGIPISLSLFLLSGH
jgi:hypothetical protein